MLKTFIISSAFLFLLCGILGIFFLMQKSSLKYVFEVESMIQIQNINVEKEIYIK